jgi:hypothetical protein
MNDLITQAKSIPVPSLHDLKDGEIDFRFGAGSYERSFGTGNWSTEIMNEDEKVLAFASTAFKEGKYYTVFYYSDMQLDFLFDGSDVLVQDKDIPLGRMPRFKIGNWSYQNDGLSITFKKIFWSLSKAMLSFGDGMSFKIRYGDGCLFSNDLNNYLLQKGGRTKKITLALILYARSFTSR